MGPDPKGGYPALADASAPTRGPPARCSCGADLRGHRAKFGPCRKAGAAGTRESAEETSVADSEGAGRSRHEEDTRKRDVPGRSGMRSGARARAARTPGTLRRTPCNRPPWRETTHENRACCEISTPPGRPVFPRSRARHRLTRANAPCRALRRERPIGGRGRRGPGRGLARVRRARTSRGHQTRRAMGAAPLGNRARLPTVASPTVPGAPSRPRRSGCKRVFALVKRCEDEIRAVDWRVPTTFV